MGKDIEDQLKGPMPAAKACTEIVFLPDLGRSPSPSTEAQPSPEALRRVVSAVRGWHRVSGAEP